MNAVSQGDDLAAMEDCAVALLGKSILEEELFQTLLSGMLRLGGVAEAERTYQKLRKALASELEVGPEERTEEIMAEAGQLRRAAPPSPAARNRRNTSLAGSRRCCCCCPASSASARARAPAPSSSAARPASARAP